MLLDSSCHCGSEQSYQYCCQPLHQGTILAETAEQLMRSRFCAFKLQLADYIQQTWDKTTRPGEITFETNMRWTRLSINGRKKGRKKDKEGWVTFVAFFEYQGVEDSLHEKSYFNRNEHGNWQYVDGDIKN